MTERQFTRYRDGIAATLGGLLTWQVCAPREGIRKDEAVLTLVAAFRVLAGLTDLMGLSFKTNPSSFLILIARALPLDLHAPVCLLHIPLGSDDPPTVPLGPGHHMSAFRQAREGHQVPDPNLLVEEQLMRHVV